MSQQIPSVDLSSLAPALLQALSVPVLVSDSRELIVFVNPAAEMQLDARVGMSLAGPLPKLAEAVKRAPIILMAVGTAYGIHILNKYYQQVLQTPDAQRRAAALTSITDSMMSAAVSGRL